MAMKHEALLATYANASGFERDMWSFCLPHILRKCAESASWYRSNGGCSKMPGIFILFAGKIHGSFLPIRPLMWLSYVTVLNYLLCLSVYLNPNQDTGCSVKATWIDILSKIEAIPLRNFSTLRHKKFYIPSCIAAIMNQGKREWESEWERGKERCWRHECGQFAALVPSLKWQNKIQRARLSQCGVAPAGCGGCQSTVSDVKKSRGLFPIASQDFSPAELIQHVVWRT